MKTKTLLSSIPYLLLLAAVFTMAYAIGSDYENFMAGLEGKTIVYKSGYLIGYNVFYLAAILLALVLLRVLRRPTNSETSN